MTKRFIRWLAMMGPVGLSPVAPATVGSAVTAAIGYFLPIPPLPVAIGAIALGAWLAIGIAGEAEKQLGHDAKPIVCDEVVGQSLALILVAHTPLSYFASFVLFRVFDVWKPLGAREAQRLPGGLGVVADDMIAGVTACGAYHLGAWGMRAAGWMR
jgi:phosphatidylglycerophosphatase A